MKKNLLLALFVLFISGIAFSQKGSVLLFGDVNYSHQKNDIQGSTKSTAFTITPGIGIGISNRFTTGLDLGYATYKSGYQSHNYGIGPFVRYTTPLSPVFSFYTQFDAQYSYYKYSSNNPDSHGIGLDILPAIEANIKNGFALNFNLGGIAYNSQKIKGVSGSSNNFSVNFGSGASFGVSKRFGTNKK